MTANIISENFLAQVDDDGHQHLLIGEIEDHRFDERAVPKSKGNYTTGSGFHRNKRTTRGWEFYVHRKGGSGDWITMKYLKGSYPVPLTDYAVVNAIQEEPDLFWWVPFTLKKKILSLKISNLNISKEPTGMGLDCRRASRKRKRLTRKTAIICGWVQYDWK